jgi:hypothetical protein
MLAKWYLYAWKIDWDLELKSYIGSRKWLARQNWRNQEIKNWRNWETRIRIGNWILK